jgi:hypothetical protein
MPVAANAAASASVPGAGDDLLLDQAIVPNPVPVATGSRWLTPDLAVATPVALPMPAGATLFERMSNIARATIAPEEVEAKVDPLDISRFLNRQNNQ